MAIEERKSLAAPCGIDCGMCELYFCRDNQQLFKYLVSIGIPEDKLPCPGCREIKGNCPVLKDTCATYECASAKNIDFCFDCTDFPCSRLNPSLDRADILPHNMKMFNLCTIQRKGLDVFIEQSAEIKKKYYNGKMEIGNGPQIENG